MKKGGIVKLDVNGMAAEAIVDSHNLITGGHRGLPERATEFVGQVGGLRLYRVVTPKAFKKAKSSPSFVPYAHLTKPVVGQDAEDLLARAV